MKVLFATDGLPAADEAADLLKRVGDPQRIDVTVVSVTHSGVPVLKHVPVMLDPIEQRRQDTVAIVDAVVEDLKVAGFTAVGRTAEGQPGHAIVNLVESDWFDLTIVGGGGRTWLGNRLLGSISTYVLHESPSSVLVVHETAPARDRSKILLGTDGSRGSDLAIQWLGAFADPSRCDVTVISAVPPLPAPVAVGPGVAVPVVDPETMTEQETRLMDRARRLADSAATQLRDAGFEVTSRAVYGHPLEQLLKEGGEHDLIAVGARGLGAFRRALLGSVSDQVARHARAAFIARRATS